MGRLRLFEDMRYCVTRQADKLEFAEIFRRERIYPFRQVTFLWGARWMEKC